MTHRTISSMKKCRDGVACVVLSYNLVLPVHCHPYTYFLALPSLHHSTVLETVYILVIICLPCTSCSLTFEYAAKEGDDFRRVSVEIIFNAETDSRQRVYIPLFNDECVEYDEYFSVDLSTTSPRVNTVNDSVNVTIIDDDC